MDIFKCYQNVNSIDLRISHICRNEYECFLNKKNVVGIGLGYKVKNGFYTWKKCIKVFVTKKINSNELLYKDLIPIMYNGIETDVVESGIFKSRTLTQHVRPAIGGYSIGPEPVDTSGTMTCLVTDGHDYYVLANNHLIARLNTMPLGTRILQPGILDKGKPQSDVIATLSKYVPIKFKGTFTKPTNYVDCAIAKAINKKLVSPAIAFLGIPQGTIIPRLQEQVKKSGRSTELTVGIITAIEFTGSIEFPNGKSALFKNQIVTTPMEQEGDSGALLLDKNNYAIGVLMSGSQTSTLYNPINLVLNNLGVKLVTHKI